MSKVRFALVGAGGIAASYAQAFAAHPDADLVSVADLRFPAAESLAGQFDRCRAFERYQSLAEGPDFDAALVCTPPNLHEEIACHFLRAGKHVLCEKPFTIGAGSARRMLFTAAQTGRVLTMASKFRYVADVIRARELIAGGLIGAVVLFENAFTSHVDMRQRWNSNPAVSGGGVLIDNGAHSLDLARYFLGPLVEVNAVEGRRIQPLDVEDTVQVFVRSVAGAVGTIDLSWSVNKELDSYVNVHGEKGTIRVGWRESRYKLAGSKEWVVFGAGYDKVQAFRNNLANFARHLRGEPLRISSRDALANVEAIDAGYRSLRGQSWAPLEEVSA
jgi:predicted dehydrogenase